MTFSGGITITGRGRTFKKPCKTHNLCFSQTPNGNIDATPYESSGTSYSQYAVINYGDGNNFQVTRRVS